MFGSYRTLLALFVVLGHMFGPPMIGHFMVFVFYIISGYLMTYIMHNTYGFNLHGRLHFALNRILRLYPMYFVAVLLTVTLLFWIGQKQVAQHFHGGMTLPYYPLARFGNATMWFLGWFPNEVSPRLIPPAWALTVEMFFYALICIGLAKYKNWVKIWLVASIGYHVITLAMGYGHDVRYYPVLAASMPFAIGAMIYFWKRDGFSGGEYLAGRHHQILAMWIANVALGYVGYALAMPDQISFWIREVCFYINIVLAAIYVMALLYNRAGMPGVNRHWDKIFGDYSYPIYIFHYAAGLIVSYLIFGVPHRGMDSQGWWVFLATVPLVLLISHLCLRWVDYPIQRFREGIKVKTVEAQKAL
jgi:peptidoglycan/LPS O-acetylase OafA/YrhL